jgi:pimeloyl-ACP methyl ester carboxylesterase
MGNVLLVHGAWVDSSCWDSVTPALRERGHRVETVELHRGTVAADTKVAQEAIDSLGTEVVACGWSYGGMVITGLDLPAGSHLVYLCAYMPDEGESATLLNLRHPGDVMTVVQGDDAGDTFLAGDEIDELVWADAPSDLAAAARASLRAQPMQTFLDAPVRVSWRDVPSTYVICRQDRTVNPDLQRELAKRATSVVEWDTSHSPMLSRPDLIVELLDGLAAR